MDNNGRLTSDDFAKVTIEHVRKAAKYIDEHEIGNASIIYKTIIGDSEYPPKSLIEIARLISENIPLDNVKLNTQFSPSVAIDRLKELNFDTISTIKTFDLPKLIEWNDIFQDKYDDYSLYLVRDDNTANFFQSWILNFDYNVKKYFSDNQLLKHKNKSILIFIENKRFKEYVFIKNLFLNQDGELGVIENHALQNFYGRLSIDFKVNAPMQKKLHKIYDKKKEIIIKEVSRASVENVQFPGYNNLLHKFKDIKIAYKLEHWEEHLKNINAVYLIRDVSTNKSYVGCSYGQFGLFGRWKVYFEFEKDGLLPNVHLKKLHRDKETSYIDENLVFNILETLPLTVSPSEAIQRETYWKDILGRKTITLNGN